MKTKNLIILILSIILMFLVGLVIKDRVSPKSLEAYSDQIINKCATERDAISCYDEEIPKLMKVVSMEDAFRVTSLIQQEDPSYAYCHVLGHELSAIETRKDPDKWKEVVARCPMGVCSNGCVHGAFQERFRSEFLQGNAFDSFKEELLTICEKREGYNPSGLEKGSCYHALGHLLMYVTEADIKKSIETCYEVADKGDKNYSPLCLDGVFMQVYQPLEDEDFELVKDITPKKGETKAFCSQFTGDAKNSCWTESWPLFLKEITTADGLVEFCTYLDTEVGQEGCFTDMFYGLPILSGFDTSTIKELCRELPAKYTGKCLSMTAIRLLEIDYGNIDKAVDFCNDLSPDEREICFDEIVKMSDFNFQSGSEEFTKLCDSLPSPWKGECLEKR